MRNAATVGARELPSGAVARGRPRGDGAAVCGRGRLRSRAAVPRGCFFPTERDRAPAALRHPLRAGDAIQLASALLLRRELGEPVKFVAYDNRLKAAAKAEGLVVVP